MQITEYLIINEQDSASLKKIFMNESQGLEWVNDNLNLEKDWMLVNLNEMTKQYLQTILNTEREPITETKPEPVLWSDKYSVEDFDETSLMYVTNDLIKFMRKAGKLVKQSDQKRLAGDFWLARNNISSFEDAGYDGETGTKLQEIVEDFFGETEAFINNCTIYVDHSRSLKKSAPLR